MFPLGGLTKAQVRALAGAADLATQARRDSQGICFLGKVGGLGGGGGQGRGGEGGGGGGPGWP
jgi:hypothetical protein